MSYPEGYKTLLTEIAANLVARVWARVETSQLAKVRDTCDGNETYPDDVA